MIRMYVSVVALFEEEETGCEWAKIQASIFRKDRDVVEVDARMVTDNELLIPMVRMVEV